MREEEVSFNDLGFGTNGKVKKQSRELEEEEENRYYYTVWIDVTREVKKSQERERERAAF